MKTYLAVAALTGFLQVAVLGTEIFRARRAAAIANVKLWTNGKVFYQMDANLGPKPLGKLRGPIGTHFLMLSMDNEVFVFVVPGAVSDPGKKVNIVYEAIREWERHTCIQFRPASRTSRGKLYFTMYSGKGCTSYVGRMLDLSSQNVTMEEGCLTKRNMLHLLGHALGLLDEQNRPDRDDYVIIHTTFSTLLNKQAAAELSIPYDYNSIMHYQARVKGALMIETRDPAYQHIIGQRKVLSFRDVKTICLLYGCAERLCPSVRTDCRIYHTEAFLGKDCKCACPGHDFLSVEPCDDLVLPATTTASPGQDFTIPKSSMTIGIMATVFIILLIAVIVIAACLINRRNPRVSEEGRQRIVQQENTGQADTYQQLQGDFHVYSVLAQVDEEYIPCASQTPPTARAQVGDATYLTPIALPGETAKAGMSAHLASAAFPSELAHHYEEA